MWGSSDDGAELLLALVDPIAATVDRFPVPDVRLEKIAEHQLGDLTVGEWRQPAIVWDTTRQRALVVQGDVSEVIVVDLRDGSIETHGIRKPTAWLDRLWSHLLPTAAAKGPSLATSSDAVLSPDGETLFVAWSSGEVVYEGDAWSLVTSPRGVTAIDTGTWEVIASFDIPASHVDLSPDGRHLVATGVTVVEMLPDGGYWSTGFGSEGTFLIETHSLQLIGSLETPDDWHHAVHFSPDGLYAYIESYGFRYTAIQLDTAEVVATRSGAEQFVVFGNAGLVVGPLP